MKQSKLPTKYSQNRKLAQPTKGGGYELRITKRKPRGKNSARTLVKCGCCDGRLEIYFSGGDDFVSINDVYASKTEWRKALKSILI